MTKTRLNIAFLFTLVTAFLMQQWTNSHVHLASEHNHDGTQHKHDIAAHAHKLIDYASSYTINHAVNSHTAANADAIDNAHQPHDSTIVELDHEYSTPNIQKQDEPSADAALFIIQRFSLYKPNTIAPPPSSINTFRHLDQSTVNPRAPPFYS